MINSRDVFIAVRSCREDRIHALYQPTSERPFDSVAFKKSHEIYHRLFAKHRRLFDPANNSSWLVGERTNLLLLIMALI
jgi:hypothetical protein